MENQVNKYRSELKYLFNRREYPIIKNQLIKYGFEKSHNYNIINNIYFDFNFKYFEDNTEGESFRRKYRIRWYNKFNGECNFEIKNKIGNSGNKIRKRLNIKDINDIEEIKNKLIDVIDVNKFKPNIQNQYFREYFIYDGVRITLDSQIKYSRYGEPNFNIQESLNIMEVKFSNETNNTLEFLNQIKLLKLDKYSKYANAIKLLKINN